MLPVLFTLSMPWGPQPIYAYGVMLGLSLVVGYQLTLHFGVKRAGLDAGVVSTAAIVAALAGLCGARALYVLENLDSLRRSHTGFIDLTSGGVSGYGGLAGGLLGAAIYLRMRRASLASFGDAAAPGLALGSVLTRIGCYLYGCDFGSVLGAGAPAFLKALGTFPRWHNDALGIYGSPAFLYHVDRYGVARDAQSALPVHPTQLYEALLGLALLGLALRGWRRRSYAGQVILPMAIVYAVLRYAVEYLREDPEGTQLAGFSSGQLCSMALLAGAAIALSLVRRDERFRTRAPAQP